jgi:ParB/RepB/Spo0J family partition protein
MNEPNDKSWEIHSSDLRITESSVVLLPVSKLTPHPDNRPLGASEEKIQQLKIFIAQNGFDSSHPLVVRPHQNSYQIIEGEHRFTAARALGYLQLPCVVRELSDTEALIQLVLGNIQTETKPLEIGLNALKVIQKEGKTFTMQQYAQRLGISDSSVRRYMNASEVYQYLKAQLPEGVPILDEVYKLEEIHRCPQTDWYWLHELTLKNEIAKNQLVEITHAIRDIKTENAVIYGLFDLLTMRQQVAQEILKGNKNASAQYLELIQTVEASYQQLEDEITLYEYNVLTDRIEQDTIKLKDWYINSLKELKQLTKQASLETYKDALQLKRNSSQEEAERTSAYFRDKKNAKEREEQERIERQMRTVKAGEFWQLGQHLLYCGDGADEAFFKRLPDRCALAYINPPRIIQGASGAWNFDKMIIKAEVIAVTPEVHELQHFLRLTQLPYRWSMCARLSRAETLMGGWIYTALFSQKNIDSRLVDFWEIDNSDLKGGSKTKDYLKHLLQNLTREHDTVIDAYGGLGTMLLLAEEMHRTCYFAEANTEFCKDLLEYWEDMSGGKAVRIA